MEAVLDFPKVKKQNKFAVFNLPCEKIILHNVSWKTYNDLIDEQTENSSV